MKKSDMMLNKLLSNNVSSVNEANRSLTGFAYNQNKWALTVIETAIKTIAGRNDVKFYSPQSGVRVYPDDSARELGKIIQEDRMLEDIALTQRLIIHSKRSKELVEFFMAGSKNEKQNRIIYSILGTQMQIRIILEQKQYDDSYCSYCGHYIGRGDCSNCGKIDGGELFAALFLATLGLFPLGAGLTALYMVIFGGTLDFSEGLMPILFGFAIIVYFIYWGIKWIWGLISLLKYHSETRKAYKKNFGQNN